MKLAIIVPVFNPCGYERPRQNLAAFLESLYRQVDRNDVFGVEAVFEGQQPAYADARWTLDATERNFLWQKEALINFAIRNLPAKYDAVAWIDADLLFQNDDWYERACQALQFESVEQLFSMIAYLDAWGNFQTGGYGTIAAQDRATWRAPGGAIACRRDRLMDGIYDRHPLGGGDEIFMETCLGTEHRFLRLLNHQFEVDVRQWSGLFWCDGKGFIPGLVKHLWHGDRRGRQYTARNHLLAAHDFDPATDVTVSENGLLAWSSDKPALHAAVRDYFVGRREDDICHSPAPSK